VIADYPKVFISQPMRNLKEQEILDKRAEAIIEVSAILETPINPVSSYFDIHVDSEVQATSLSALGRSIEYLGIADYAYFVKGWENARGCRIEHACCIEYGIPIIEGKV